MKRDMELIRLILLDAEDEKEVDFSHFTPEELFYHKSLLLEAGYINGVPFSSPRGADVAILSLTWEGHDFLDAARDDRVWKEALRQAGKVGGAVSLEMMKALLAAAATSLFSGTP